MDTIISPNNSTTMERTMINPRHQTEVLDQAGKMLDKHLHMDNSFPTLFEVMHLEQHGEPTVSGLSEFDYPNALPNLRQLTLMNKVPLPPEVLEHFGHMECNCMMGIFPEIGRAWLTIDSDIFVWTYEYGSDVAFFDSLNETIMCVGLVKPKPGVFHNMVKYLLILTTSVEIVILGVTFSKSKEGPLGSLEEMHLLPDPVFSLPTDGVQMTSIAGTKDGRIFLGGRDGCFYELLYQAEASWFGKRCRKVNHSTSRLSFLVPSFVSSALSENSPITQLTVDNSRGFVYTLAENGTIEGYVLNREGVVTRIARINQTTLVRRVLEIVRTLDSDVFIPLASISAIESSESAHMHLVVVSHAGVRLYLACAGSGTDGFVLYHVRLPPGYTATTSGHRPINVHMAKYSHGTIVMVSSPNPERNILWCLSSDPFPFHPHLVEAQSIMPLDGPAWALAEIRPPAEESQPPLAVRQHAEPPAKYIILTPQGASIYAKMRPVDLLRQALIEARGADADIVCAYFKNHKEEQACATCLVLACLETAPNLQVAEWATRAFFLYGGEPRVHTTQTPIATITSPTQAAHYTLSNFRPNIASTPVLGNVGITSPIGNEHRRMNTEPTLIDSSALVFSAKHAGLYLYFGRLVRHFWSDLCVKTAVLETREEVLVSAISRDECSRVLGYVQNLHAFLTRNSTLLCSMGEVNALSAERRSLEALKALVAHSCQVLGLWRVLCEHSVPEVLGSLPLPLREQLVAARFKHLICAGQQLCSALINAIINQYLNDNASIDSLSMKLREVCPGLYKNEDAVCSKANEILLTVKTLQSPEEREIKLQEALKMCKVVAPRVNLPLLCERFAAAGCLTGVLELCQACAVRLDPSDTAWHYYKQGQPGADSEGASAFRARMDCYKALTDTLDRLCEPPTTDGNSSAVDAAARHLVDAALRSSDPVCHVAVYEWLAARGTLGAIAPPQPSLELYLSWAAERDPRDSRVAELLWQLHERRGDHLAAATLLRRLAFSDNPDVALAQRIEYLSRAVASLRSADVGCMPRLGLLLRDLEDLLDVARIQNKILDCLKNSCISDRRVNEIINRLNSSLLTITELYEEACEPFDLAECQLRLIAMSGHHDIVLVEALWSRVLSYELNRAAELRADEITTLLTKVSSLGHEVALSPRCFPLSFLVRTLELEACRLNAESGVVVAAFISLGVSIPRLLEEYANLSSASRQEPRWAEAGDAHRPARAAANLVKYLVNNPHVFPQAERGAILARADDLISSLLTAAYCKQDTGHLIEYLRGVQSQLSRLVNS